MRRPVSVLLAAALLIPGCGGRGPVRLEASSEASIDASLAAMRDQVDATRRKELDDAVASLTMPAEIKAAFDDRAPKPDKVTVFKPLDGLTADQIITKAQEQRANAYR